MYNYLSLSFKNGNLPEKKNVSEFKYLLTILEAIILSIGDDSFEGHKANRNRFGMFLRRLLSIKDINVIFSDYITHGENYCFSSVDGMQLSGFALLSDSDSIASESEMLPETVTVRYAVYLVATGWLGYSLVNSESIPYSELKYLCTFLKKFITWATVKQEIKDYKAQISVPGDFFYIGNKVHWVDPGLNSYSEEFVEQYSRVFTICQIDGKSDTTMGVGVTDDFNVTLLISDEYGEAEVYAKELVLVEDTMG